MTVRIQKPLSAKQRANIAQLRSWRIIVVDRRGGLPEASWWTTAPREGWDQVVASEAARMAQSRFARLLDPTYGS